MRLLCWQQHAPLPPMLHRHRPQRHEVSASPTSRPCAPLRPILPPAQSTCSEAQPERAQSPTHPQLHRQPRPAPKAHSQPDRCPPPRVQATRMTRRTNPRHSVQKPGPPSVPWDQRGPEVPHVPLQARLHPYSHHSRSHPRSRHPQAGQASHRPPRHRRYPSFHLPRHRLAATQNTLDA